MRHFGIIIVDCIEAALVLQAKHKDYRIHPASELKDEEVERLKLTQEREACAKYEREKKRKYKKVKNKKMEAQNFWPRVLDFVCEVNKNCGVWRRAAHKRRKRA